MLSCCLCSTCSFCRTTGLPACLKEAAELLTRCCAPHDVQGSQIFCLACRLLAIVSCCACRDTTMQAALRTLVLVRAQAAATSRALAPQATSRSATGQLVEQHLGPSSCTTAQNFSVAQITTESPQTLTMAAAGRQPGCRDRHWWQWPGWWPASVFGRPCSFLKLPACLWQGNME